MSVAVVTDSTCYAPEGFLSGEIKVVPLQVYTGSRSDKRLDSDLSSHELIRLLESGRKVTTSGAGPSQFTQVYRDCAAEGASEIVSIHLSSELSHTVKSAQIGGRHVGIPVTVVDSRSVAMGLGFGVWDAWQAARRGVDGERVAQLARQTSQSTQAFFAVDTLTYLHRGGRIGSAEAALGQMLGVRPVLALREGAIVPAERARTTTRARARVLDLAVKCAEEFGVARVAVHHLGALGPALDMVETIRERLGLGAHEVLLSEIGAVLGAHTGPGLVAIVVTPG